MGISALFNDAIVSDVHYRMSLAAVRSLGRRGIPVTALEYENIDLSQALGFYSRYTGQKAVIPHPRDPQAFIGGLRQMAGRFDNKPVLIAAGLDSVMAMSSLQGELEEVFHLLVPPYESLLLANDTGRLLEVAGRAGVPGPDTTTLGEGEDIEELSQRLDYPVVIKYREGELLQLGPEQRYRIINNARDFVTAYSYMHEKQSCPLVQGYVSGGGYGVSAVFDRNSQPVEIFCHHRIREYPVSGGPSCLCEALWDDRMVGYAVSLLKELKWQGVAMVEFKGDPNGDVRLMEINPRFWGSLPLPIIAGCDIPCAIYDTARGVRHSDYSGTVNWTPDRYRMGTRMRFIFQDLMSFPGYLKARSDKAAFAGEFTRDLFSLSIRDGVWDWQDLRPSLRYLSQSVGKFFSGH
ncbi:MAG: ATP-grasp domain-containing protein [Deltaproteobacteria bacterium]